MQKDDLQHFIQGASYSIIPYRGIPGEYLFYALAKS